MTDYKDLIVRLRLNCCRYCKLWDGTGCRLDGDCSSHAKLEAANAIEAMNRRETPMKITEIHVDEYYCPVCGQRLLSEPPKEET